MNINDIELIKDKANSLVNTTKDDLNNLKSDLLKLMEPVREIEKELEKVQKIAEGTIKEKKYIIHGITYTKDKLQDAFNYLLGQREKLFNETFKDWDIRFCASYLTLARNEESDYELIKLYEQHAVISKVYKKLVEVKSIIYDDLAQLQSRDDVKQFEVANFGERVNNNMLELSKTVSLLDEITFVKLPNIDSVDDLKNAIVEDGEFKQEKGNMFENGGFERTVNSIEMGINHCQRIDQKSVGVILLFHKSLESQLVKEEMEIK